MRKALKWLTIALVAFAVGAPVVGAWVLSGMMLRPPWYEFRGPEQGFSPRIPITDPKQAHGLPFETVEFLAMDGSTLRGWYVPGAPHATAGVVAVHGGGADRRHLLSITPMLHAAGYPVLLFDCREHGISDGEGYGLAFGIREYADTQSAVAWMKGTRSLQRIAVIGSSQGAASAIIAAALDPAIDVVVAENSYTNLFEMLRDTRSEAGSPPDWLSALMAQMARYRLDAGDLPSPIVAIADIEPRPLLLMHGTEDDVIPASHSVALFAAAGKGKELWMLEDAEHSQLFKKDPVAFEAKLTGFLAEHLGPAN
jgi:fermentation-respiration switch protein FrsA (DUF1100 family)